jgi:UDP:flavonoid glycosyltransferase YjiC (YdhE family)
MRADRLNIAILALGTRGDAQPGIALGKALKARDYDLVLGAPGNFAS